MHPKDRLGRPGADVEQGSGRFEDRWVALAVDPASPCVYTSGLSALELPARHGEGRLVAPSATRARLEAGHFVPLRYADAEGQPTEAYPANPNGSAGGIAGLVDATGRVFGLMPHPEAFLDFTNHPRWTRLAVAARRQGQAIPRAGQGLAIFTNVVGHAARHFGAVPVKLS
jgi:phosphoribosylformylglycinamidine synthase